MPNIPQGPTKNESFAGLSSHAPAYPDIAPETCLRIMDKAMLEWLQSIRFRGQEPTLVAGWKSRYFSSVKEMHGDKRLGDKQQVPLPMIALLNQGLSPDPSRFVFGNVRRLGPGAADETNTIYHGTPPNEEGVLFLPWPLPVDITYQIELWTKEQQDMRYLRTALLMQWSTHPTETYLRVVFPAPYGEKLIPLQFERDDNISDLEPGEQERRLRHAFTVTMKGWLFKVPILQKTIKNAHVVFLHGSYDELVDWYCNIDNYNFNADYSVLESIDEP